MKRQICRVDLGLIIKKKKWNLFSKKSYRFGARPPPFLKKSVYINFNGKEQKCNLFYIINIFSRLDRTRFLLQVTSDFDYFKLKPPFGPI